MNKFLLAGYRYSGVNFCRELIRENFPECVDRSLWWTDSYDHKKHIPLNKSEFKWFEGRKVFFILSDPRDTAARVAFLQNKLNSQPYEFSTKARNDMHGLQFLNEAIDLIITMVNFYTRHFGDNCIVLRYEDAYFNTTQFIDKVGAFLNLVPLYVDDVRKYKNSIHKDIGVFRFFYDGETLGRHYSKYRDFYEKWEYPYGGFENRFYTGPNNHGIPEIDYKTLLTRNNVSLFDEGIVDRIKGIKKI